jgi:hypothetical protein
VLFVGFRALNWLVAMRWNIDDRSGIARAEESIDAALALQTDNSSAHDETGRVFFAKGQWGRAVAEGEAAIATRPQQRRHVSPASFSNCSIAARHDGDTVAAVTRKKSTNYINDIACHHVCHRAASRPPRPPGPPAATKIRKQEISILPLRMRLALSAASGPGAWRSP